MRRRIALSCLMLVLAAMLVTNISAEDSTGYLEETGPVSSVKTEMSGLFDAKALSPGKVAQQNTAGSSHQTLPLTSPKPDLPTSSAAIKGGIQTKVDTSHKMCLLPNSCKDTQSKMNTCYADTGEACSVIPTADQKSSSPSLQDTKGRPTGGMCPLPPVTLASCGKVSKPSGVPNFLGADGTQQCSVICAKKWSGMGTNLAGCKLDCCPADKCPTSKKKPCLPRYCNLGKVQFINVPQGWVATLFAQDDYKGEKLELRSSTYLNTTRMAHGQPWLEVPSRKDGKIIKPMRSKAGRSIELPLSKVPACR